MENQIKREIELKAPINKVWEALTDYKKFGQWFRVEINEPFAVGEESTGTITHDGCKYKWEAVVLKMEEPTLFSYLWPPGAEPGEKESKDNWTLVEFHLKEIPTGTLLTLRESGFNKVPEHRRAAAFRENSGGWDFQMKNIKEYVEK